METMMLPVKLNDEERRLRGEELAKLTIARCDAEDARKAVAKQLKDEVEALAVKERSLARVIARGAEDRPTDVEWTRDDTRCSMEIVRQDTGEVVSSRPMTAAEREERQVSLFPVAGEKRAE